MIRFFPSQSDPIYYIKWALLKLSRYALYNFITILMYTPNEYILTYTIDMANIKLNAVYYTRIYSAANIKLKYCILYSHILTQVLSVPLGLWGSLNKVNIKWKCCILYSHILSFFQSPFYN